MFNYRIKNVARTAAHTFISINNRRLIKSVWLALEISAFIHSWLVNVRSPDKSLQRNTQIHTNTLVVFLLLTVVSVRVCVIKKLINSQMKIRICVRKNLPITQKHLVQSDTGTINCDISPVFAENVSCSEEKKSPSDHFLLLVLVTESISNEKH